MNKLFNFFLVFFLFFSFSAFPINTNAPQAIVFDFNTNEVLFEKNSNQFIAPASMTKIMTSYIVFDRLKNTSLTLKDKCIVSKKAYKMGGSRMFLEINNRVTINDLLRGIIVQSGNDASVTIAECLSGTEEDFALIMNEYAKKIGMKNTNFSNSSGWPDKKHYSTVKDLLLLSNKLILDFPKYYQYFKEKKFKYNNINQPNRNKLLVHVEGTDGLKTGYTKDSGYGIASSVIRDERRISVVINGSKTSRERLNESEKLINWAFRETIQKNLVEKNQFIKEVDVWLGSKPTINLIVNETVITTISFDQIKTLKSYVEFENPISAPIEKGDILGKLIIEIHGKPNLIIPLTAERKINSINPLLKVFAALKYLMFGSFTNE